MEGEVVTVQPLCRIHPFLFTGRIVNLHTQVEAQQEETEIQSDACTPVGGNAFSQPVPAEYGRI